VRQIPDALALVDLKAVRSVDGPAHVLQPTLVGDDR
jgi:hypothetical protein